MASQFVSFTPAKSTRTAYSAQCYCNRVSQIPAPKDKNGYKNIKIKTLDNCKVNISKYNLLYNGQRGRGTGHLVKIKDDELNGNDTLKFEFDLGSVDIPAMTNRTAKFLGQGPLPPMFKIDVIPEIIQAHVYVETGKVEVIYKAKLWLSIGIGYKANPLLIDMIFTTEELKAAMIKGIRGKRLDKYGKCKLVGVAKVDPIDDQFVNSVIGLPSNCLTSLNAIISFF